MTWIANGESGSSVRTKLNTIPNDGTSYAGGNVFPQGRLTLVSATPVMISDQTAKGTIYYAEYTGNSCPVYNGTLTQPLTFSNISLILDTSSHLSAHVYDVFFYSAAGVATLGTGPVWSSNTTRGTGAGTTELQLKNGVWTNANSIVLINNSVSSSAVAANQATYLGTFYATANGQTGMAFKPAAANGGSNNILGLWNAYNRVRYSTISHDNTASWTYSTTTWRSANNSASNRISWVDGLAQSGLVATLNQALGTSSNGVEAIIGTGLDTTSTTPLETGGTAGAIVSVATVAARPLPTLGFHFLQAMEYGTASTCTFYGAANSNQQQSLVGDIDM